MPELARLKWRCRRGTKEMDLILERFLEQFYPDLPAAQAEVFERLLEELDMDIMDWILGRSKPLDPDYQPLIDNFRQLNTAGSE